MDDKELKEEFIKYFGKDRWNEEEQLTIYQNAIFTVCNEYLGIQPIPVIFDSLDGEVSRYDIKNQVIILNNKYINNYEELLDSTLHELEHYWQHLYVSNCDTPKARRWKELFKTYDPSDITCELEIDACAFAQVIAACEFGVTYKNSIPEIQKIIDLYIQSKRILSDE